MEIEFAEIDKRRIFEKTRRMFPLGRIQIKGKAIVNASATKLGKDYAYYAEILVDTRIVGNAISRNAIMAYAEAMLDLDKQD